MNRTKLLYRLALVASCLLFLTAAVLAVAPGLISWQISSLAVGAMGAVLTGHLRMRMTLAGQRGITTAVRGLASRDLGARALEPTLAGITAALHDDSADMRVRLGDTQAAVAASESFVLAELISLRQQIAAGKAIGNAEPNHQPH